MHQIGDQGVMVGFSAKSLLSPMHSRKLNWTELDRSVFRALSQVRRPSQVLDSQEPATAIANRRSSSPVFIQRQTLRWLADSQVCPDCEEPATTAESSQVVAGSMHSGKLNWTVELSWVQFPAVYWALLRCSHTNFLLLLKVKSLKCECNLVSENNETEMSIYLLICDKQNLLFA